LVVFPILAVLALSVTGIAYSAWFDIVMIEGKVEMGSLTLAFDWVEPPSCEEFYLDPETGVKVPGEWKGKDVAQCSAWYDGYAYDEHTGKEGWKVLFIEVFNAYPQLYVHTTFKLHNIGTIPIDICKYVITGAKFTGEGEKVCDLVWYDPDGDWIGGLFEDYNGNGVMDDDENIVINLEITNALPYQIDPCNTNKAEIDMDFKQEAQECHTYKIWVTVWGIQWNKPCAELDGEIPGE
jgi:hypothetical protein